MSQFETKPYKIEAVQWFKDGDHPAVQLAFGEDWFFVQTRQGIVRVDPGDWIITLSDGETYPCKPDVFAAKYRPAGETATHRILKAFADHWIDGPNDRIWINHEGIGEDVSGADVLEALEEHGLEASDA